MFAFFPLNCQSQIWLSFWFFDIFIHLICSHWQNLRQWAFVPATFLWRQHIKHTQSNMFFEVNEVAMVNSSPRSTYTSATATPLCQYVVISLPSGHCVNNWENISACVQTKSDAVNKMQRFPFISSETHSCLIAIATIRLLKPSLA